MSTTQQTEMRYSSLFVLVGVVLAAIVFWLVEPVNVWAATGMYFYVAFLFWLCVDFDKSDVMK